MDFLIKGIYYHEGILIPYYQQGVKHGKKLFLYGNLIR